MIKREVVRCNCCRKSRVWDGDVRPGVGKVCRECEEVLRKLEKAMTDPDKMLFVGEETMEVW